jgi:hypothetical protein
MELLSEICVVRTIVVGGWLLVAGMSNQQPTTYHQQLTVSGIMVCVPQ